MSDSLTLYDINTELLELIEARDELAEEIAPDPVSAKRKAEELEQLSQAIAVYIAGQIQKVDNIAGFVAECTTRSTVLQLEADRYYERAKRWQSRAEAVKKATADALALLVPIEEIIAAKQNQVLKRLRGRTVEMKLCKSSAGVAENIDLSLLPDELQRVEIVVTKDELHWIKAALQDAFDSCYDPSGTLSRLIAELNAIDTFEPMKGEIAKKLKAGEPVAGASLKLDSVHVRFS
jgi:hypothetical protein